MARLGTDPLLYNYYWLAAEILALVGIAMLFPKTETWQKVVMIAGFYAVSFVAFVDPIPATVARFGLLLALLVAAYRASPSPPARDRVPGTMTPKAASEFLP
jgi:hypothetical protein